MVLGRRLVAVFSALVLILLPLMPPAWADSEPRKPERAEWVSEPHELPGGGLSPMLLAAIGGYLLTGGLALLLLRR
ncbi:hypothetical protein QLQ12_08590 [Actinoplanes sp. NEAU-A12]|uniref:Uncharacterized protein n=1 Tax=Actinoplanes sandaracinus TaxID=3045177 RepID=A0ABT6WG35_9ACTN|nr:hypothetical protein [Actinoplanes sandaracinus]MDI6098658.1 hypothetical protein [Actinoplanes sandaracinus]